MVGKNLQRKGGGTLQAEERARAEGEKGTTSSRLAGCSSVARQRAEEPAAKGFGSRALALGLVL